MRTSVRIRALLAAAVAIIAAPLVSGQQPMETSIPDKVRLGK